MDNSVYNACDCLRVKHAALPEKIDRFQRALRDLYYDGDVSFGQHLLDLKTSVRLLREDLEELIAYEENFLFPFLKSHIPRLEPIIMLLGSEHEDFRRISAEILEDLERAEEDSEKRDSVVRRLKDDGTYLACLLRSHNWIEEKQIYPAVEGELKPEEKKIFQAGADVFRLRHSRLTRPEALT